MYGSPSKTQKVVSKHLLQLECASRILKASFERGQKNNLCSEVNPRIPACDWFFYNTPTLAQISYTSVMETNIKKVYSSGVVVHYFLFLAFLHLHKINIHLVLSVLLIWACFSLCSIQNISEPRLCCFSCCEEMRCLFYLEMFANSMWLVNGQPFSLSKAASISSSCCLFS